MGKIVFEEGRLFFDKLSTNVSDFCKTEKEGFKKPEYSRIEIETDGQNEQHIGVLKAFAGHILRGTPLVAEGTEGIRGLTLECSGKSAGLYHHLSEMCGGTAVG